MNISVYITSYNQLAYLVEAVQSVLAQSLHPSQLIIVDDASTDGSQAYLQTLTDQYPGWMTPIFHTQNQGIALTRNDALRAVTGEYVTYLDGDDRYLPNKLETEAQALAKHPTAQIAYSDYYIIDAKGQRIDRWATYPPPQGDIFLKTFGRKFPRGRLFRDELVRYDAWQNIGFYDETLRVYEDYDARIRLSHTCHAAYTGKPLTEHRRLGAGLSKLDGQIYLDTFDYILQKNKPLLANQTPQARNMLEQSWQRWRAALWRRKGRQALAQTPPNRKTALRAYRTSFHHYPSIDALFWLEFILSPARYQRLKRWWLQKRGV